MTAPDLVSALLPVVDVLQALGVPYFVTGSMASSAHGVARASLDADVVADLADDHVEPFCDALEARYYVPRGHVRRAVADRTSFNVISLESAVKVDVFLAGGRPLDRRALARAVVRQMGDLAVPTASAEDVVLTKLDWFQRGGGTSERQWNDVVGVLRVQGRQLDLPYLRSGAIELDVVDLLDRVLVELDLIAGNEGGSAG